eukprot:13566557-Alexandrium_andersonii.AAC.1
MQLAPSRNPQSYGPPWRSYAVARPGAMYDHERPLVCKPRFVRSSGHAAYSSLHLLGSVPAVARLI